MSDENVVPLSIEDERRIREEVAHLEIMSPISKSGEEMAYERDCLFLLDEVDRLRKWKEERTDLTLKAGYCAEKLKEIRIILQRINAIHNPDGDEVTSNIAREAEAIIKDIEFHGE